MNVIEKEKFRRLRAAMGDLLDATAAEVGPQVIDRLKLDYGYQDDEFLTLDEILPRIRSAARWALNDSLYESL